MIHDPQTREIQALSFRDRVKQKLRSFPDKEVLRLLDLIIDSYHFAGSDATPRGLPMGNQSSQWFALYYLDGVDRMIKERYRICYYTRYMDDLVLVHEDKAYLRSILNALTNYAKEELHLRHGHTWKLKKHVFGKFVLSRSKKE